LCSTCFGILVISPLILPQQKLSPVVQIKWSTIELCIYIPIYILFQSIFPQKKIIFFNETRCCCVKNNRIVHTYVHIYDFDLRGTIRLCIYAIIYIHILFRVYGVASVSFLAVSHQREQLGLKLKVSFAEYSLFSARPNQSCMFPYR